MSWEFLRRSALVLALLLLAPVAGSSGGPWQQILLDGPIQTTLADGSVRTLNPSCSGGPQAGTGAAGPAADTQYSFFIQKGNPNKILFILDGGGACWNTLTCLTLATAYVRHVNETPEVLAGLGGLFDSTNPANPYHNYTKVFVPYCTGDVHWGSVDRQYTSGVTTRTIRHRGADNFLAVIDWLAKNGEQFQVDLRRVQDLTVSGPSAGGYGAMLAFPYLAELTPRARHQLLVDGAVGVLTPAGYAATIYNVGGTEAWRLKDNLPPWVPAWASPQLNTEFLFASSASPNSFAPMFFQALRDYKPAAHMALLTHHCDATQIQFYQLMGGGASAWNLNMKAITAANASVPTYRHFIDTGSLHTFMRSNGPTYDVGPNGVSVSEWVRNMIKPGNRTWDNLDSGGICPIPIP